MRDPARIAVVLEELEQMWRRHPNWRLGQLVSNLAAWADPSRDMVWDIEDEVLLAEIRRHMTQLEVSQVETK